MGVVPYEQELMTQIKSYRDKLEELQSPLRPIKLLNKIQYYEGCIEGSRWLLRSYTCGADNRYILAGYVRKHNLLKRLSDGCTRNYLQGYCDAISKHLHPQVKE